MKVKVIRKRRPAPVATEQVKEKTITHESQDQTVTNHSSGICVNISLNGMLKNAMRTTTASDKNSDQDSKKTIFEYWIPMTTDRDTISKAQEICKRTKEVIRRHYCVSSDNNL